MRSSAALVYNCKQARIVLAGTSFATTKALAFLRSAELARSIEKLRFLNPPPLKGQELIQLLIASIFPVPSLFVQVQQTSEFKRILNADTQNIRITNADGQVNTFEINTKWKSDNGFQQLTLVYNSKPVKFKDARKCMRRALC